MSYCDARRSRRRSEAAAQKISWLFTLNLGMGRGHIFIVLLF